MIGRSTWRESALADHRHCSRQCGTSAEAVLHSNPSLQVLLQEIERGSLCSHPKQAQLARGGYRAACRSGALTGKRADSSAWFTVRTGVHAASVFRAGVAQLRQLYFVAASHHHGGDKSEAEFGPGAQPRHIGARTAAAAAALGRRTG